MALHLNIFLCCKMQMDGGIFLFFVCSRTSALHADVSALLMVSRIDPDEKPTRVFTKCQRLLLTKEKNRTTKLLSVLFFVAAGRSRYVVQASYQICLL